MAKGKTQKEQPTKHVIKVLDFTIVKGFKFGFGFVIGGSVAMFIFSLLLYILSILIKVPMNFPV